MVRSNKEVVRDAKTFCDVCQNLKAIVIFAPLHRIESSKTRLDKIWDNVIPVKGTQKIHQIIAVARYVIDYKLHAMLSEEVTRVNMRLG